MLRIIQSVNAAGAKAYYSESLSKADYHSEGQEVVGHWGGLAATRLGLEGPVNREDFAALCENLHPRTGDRLTCRTREGRTVGYDVNFHCPKSVSLVYALNQDERVLHAFRAAVAETMTEMEQGMHTRVRKDGRDEERLTANLAYAEFIHLTSRPVGGIPSMHLHAHCYTFNATFDAEENAWKAGQFRQIKRDAPYYESAFRARLAGKLAAFYAIERTRNGFEIAGIARSTIEKFSPRTRQIEEAAHTLGVHTPEAKDRLGAQTREPKRTNLPLDQLRGVWQGWLNPDERQALGRLGEARPSGEPVTAREAVDHAIAHAFERESVVTDTQIASRALTYGAGSVSVESVWQELESRDLIRRPDDGRQQVTTREVLVEEAELLAFARQGRGTCRPFAAASGELPQNLNDEQRQAVRHVLESFDRVVLLRGVAGTGKTSLMRTATRAIEEGGTKVFAFAPTAEASRGVLRREGFAEADTVARLLTDKSLQEKIQGQAIWLDEASLIGSRDLAKIFRLAKERGARVVMMGDARQHSAVPRGQPFRLLQDLAGLPLAEVQTIQRQRGEYKAAVEELSRGETGKALDRLDRLGFIKEIPGHERYREIARDYLEAMAKGKSVLAVSPTHAEGRQVTEAIRTGLREQGRLGKEREFFKQTSFGLTEALRGDPVNYQPGDTVQFHQNGKGGFRRGERLTVSGRDEKGRVLARRASGEETALPLDQAGRFDLYASSSLQLAAGDRIRITANGKTRDGKHRLNNGSLHEVKGFTKDGHIQLANGYVIDRAYGHIDHGYSTTSHASQGKTVDQVLVAMSSTSWPASSAEQFYVSVSRARERVTVYTDSKEGLREAAGQNRPRLSAVELSRQTVRDRLLRNIELARLQEAGRPVALPQKRYTSPEKSANIRPIER